MNIHIFNEHTHAIRRTGAGGMTMMPIGVPKVAYKMPGSRGGEWVDIYQRLTRERIIFMGAEIDDEMANQIIGVLLVLQIQYIDISLLIFVSHRSVAY
jgi:ATP-dependent Clp protease, protease subunit